MTENDINKTIARFMAVATKKVWDDGVTYLEPRYTHSLDKLIPVIRKAEGICKTEFELRCFDGEWQVDFGKIHLAGASAPYIVARAIAQMHESYIIRKARASASQALS